MVYGSYQPQRDRSPQKMLMPLNPLNRSQPRTSRSCSTSRISTAHSLASRSVSPSPLAQRHRSESSTSLDFSSSHRQSPPTPTVSATPPYCVSLAQAGCLTSSSAELSARATASGATPVTTCARRAGACLVRSSRPSRRLKGRSRCGLSSTSVRGRGERCLLLGLGMVVRRVACRWWRRRALGRRRTGRRGTPLSTRSRPEALRSLHVWL